MAHLEMVCAMVHQLTRNLTEEQIKESGFDKYFVDHTNAVYPVAASGVPWTASYIQAKGDVIADLHEDMAAEQKARVTYENLLRLIDDPDIIQPLKFLREREIVHYQRFGDATLPDLNGLSHIKPRYNYGDCSGVISVKLVFKILVNFFSTFDFSKPF